MRSTEDLEVSLDVRHRVHRYVRVDANMICGRRWDENRGEENREWEIDSRKTWLEIPTKSKYAFYPCATCWAGMDTTEGEDS